MKLIRSGDGDFQLQLSRQERAVLLAVLRLYPLVPSSYHRLSRNAPPDEVAADQKLLDEALAAQKAENQRRLQAWFGEGGEFKPLKRGFALPLSASQVDWLLQVLNDVRVGSWIKLGCPDDRNGRPAQLTSATARYLFALDYCGLIQSLLLQGIDASR